MYVYIYIYYAECDAAAEKAADAETRDSFGGSADDAWLVSLGRISPYSGRDCVKSLRSSYTGSYLQSEEARHSSGASADDAWLVSESGPLRAVHLSRYKWPGGLVNGEALCGVPPLPRSG